METFWRKQGVSCVMKILQRFLYQTAVEIGMYHGYDSILFVAQQVANANLLFTSFVICLSSLVERFWEINSI